MGRVSTAGTPPECYTLKEFCAAHRIGLTTYYNLQEQGIGPETFRIGTGPKAKVLITKEAAARWRAARDEAARKAAPRESC